MRTNHHRIVRCLTSPSRRGCLFPSKRRSPQAPAALDEYCNCKMGQVCYIITQCPRKIHSLLSEASSSHRKKIPWPRKLPSSWFSGASVLGGSVKSFQLLGSSARGKEGGWGGDSSSVSEGRNR